LWELDQVRERINHALADAAAIKIVSNSDRSELVAARVSTCVPKWPTVRTHRRFSPSKSDLPSGWSITKQEEKDGTTNFSVAVPAGAQTPHTPGDWMYPFPPAMVSASRMLKWTDTRLISARPS